MKRLESLSVIALTALLLSSCPAPVDWSVYAYTNLIAARTFDATVSGIPVWYFADGLQKATGGNADFVVWEAVSDPLVYDPTGSLPAEVTGPVYRYEIVNLLPNGDFEDPGALATHWSSTDTTNAVVDAATPLHGSGSLYLNLEFPTNLFYTDLAAPPTGLTGGFPADTRFAFHFDFRMPVQTLGMELNNGVTGSVQGQWQISRVSGQDENQTYSFPGTAILEPAYTNRTNSFIRDSDDPTRTFFSIGGLTFTAQARAEGLFDDMRIVRADQGHYLRVRVPYRDSLDGTRPELIGGGTYTISVWVRTDPTAGSSNRMVADYFSVGIDTTVAGSVAAVASATVPTVGPTNLQSITDWTELTYTISGDEVRIDGSERTDEIVFDIVFEIGRYISGSEYCDAGSVLLAAPSLEWTRY